MPTSGSLTKKLTKNAGWLFSGGMATAVFASAEAIILARMLGIEQFGLLSLIIAYVGIVNGIIDVKSPEAVVRYVGQCWETGKKDRTVSFIKLFYLFDFLVGAAAFAVCVLLAGAANNVFIHSEATFGLVLVYSASLLVSSVNQTSESVLRVFDRFRTLAFLRTLHIGIRTGLVCLCLLAGFGIKGVFVSYVAAAFAFFIMLQVTVSGILRKEGLSSWTGAKIENPMATLAEIRSFVLTSTLSGFLSNVMSRQFPLLLLGHFANHQAAGLYKVAVIFSRVIMKLRDPVDLAVYPPLVAARSRNSPEDFAKIISHATRNIMKFFLPVGAVFFLFASEFILVFFGSEYQAAASAMRFIIVAEVLSGFHFWIDGAEMATDRLKQRTARSIVSAAAYAGALFLLVPGYSYDGAAAAKLVPSLIALAVSLFLFRSIRKEALSAKR